MARRMTWNITHKKPWGRVRNRCELVPKAHSCRRVRISKTSRLMHGSPLVERHTLGPCKNREA